jgi:hypothetical protein
MIVVCVDRTWPLASAGPLDVTCVVGAWRIAPERLATFGAHGDVLVAVCENRVVAAFDITGHTRDKRTHRVTFSGIPSSRWHHLLGRPTPSVPWGRNRSAWPLRFVETEMLDPNWSREPSTARAADKSR